VSEWKPIESAPRDQTWILAWLPLRSSKKGGEVILTQWYVHWLNGKPNTSRAPEWRQDDMHGGFGGYSGPIEPTHWMPLPPPPTGDEQ
jgi:hypothetical protein